ncbi:AsmA-like C-terminal region-containing protein [Hoeflea prorocentri]|uniref:AsmA family protein n=1 Tax=Hoeflea prorocentri TaxID=1922333 RepID=A0A9X3ZG94_9HYPH|nr:AsmA-like C-terminal region-containing protein [Hoeflea prorocentri]MCY6379964.1 AsmA family protein [Hoeflea prorocentri]MDA5397764.1 AsmA family protein [Hoeflea prorocentri]
MFVFFGGLLVLALFAALIGPYFVDWSSYRQEFEREAGRILGQKVQVLGDADARLLPFPSVSFDNVVVGEGDDGQPMMTVDRFSMDAELAPFLSGEIRIFDMRIESPQATVRLSPTGELDWALRSHKTLPGNSLTLESITVTGGSALVIDEQNGREHRLEDVDMRMSAKSIAGPWNMDGSAVVDGYGADFTLTTGAFVDENRIRLKARVMPAALPVSVDLEGDLRIEELKPQYKGSFQVRALDPSKIKDENGATVKSGRRPIYARATGVFELNNERLRIEDYRLETGPANDPYIISGEATFDTGRNPEFLLVADGQQLNLARMTGDQDQEEVNAVSFGDRLSSLRRLLSLAPVPQMPGKVSVALPAILAGDTTVRDVMVDATPDGEAWRINRMEAKLPGRTQFLASGRLGVGAAFGFSGEVIVASNQPSGFASWLTDSVDPAIRRLEAAGLSARVDLSTQLQRFDQLEIAVGPAILKGRLERVVPIQGRPSMSLVLDGDEVDLDALRAFAGLIIGNNQESRLAGHDVSARLSAQRFLASGFAANDTDVALRLKGGTLDIDRLTINDLAGASVSGVGRLENVFTAPVGDVDVSMMTESSGRFLTLLSRLGGAHPVLDHLGANAALFGETSIDVQTRFAPGLTEGTSLSSRVRGRTGGSRFNILVERNDAFAPLDTGQISITADLGNSEPRTLLAQIGIDSLPVELPGPASLDLRVEGSPSQELAFSFGYDAPDTQLSARGKGWQDQDRILQGDFKLQFNSDDLTPYLAMNGLNLTDPGLSLPAQWSADILTSSRSYLLENLQGIAGESEFAGKVFVERNSEIADLRGELTLTEVDFPYLADLMLGPGTTLSGTTDWSNAQFLPPLQGNLEFDFDITAKTAALHFGPKAENWSGKLVLKDNELQWRDVGADWLGGKLAGGLTLANRDATALLSGQFQVNGADIDTIVWKRDGFPVATGTFDASAAFEGAGTSVRDLVSSLSGSGIIQANGLEIVGVENESLSAILTAADTEGFEADRESVGILADATVSGGTFYADSMAVPFTMAAGTLRMPNIVLDDSGASVRGEARFNLQEGAVDARFDIEFDPEDAALTGAAPAISIAFLGPVGAPDRTIDVAELANFLSLRAFERERRRVEILQAVVLENQRMRREALLAKEQERAHRDATEQREREIDERAANEAERLEQERLAAIEAERRAEQEAQEAALRAQEEEERRQLEEAQLRAAQNFADRLLRGDASPPQQDDFLLQLENAVRQAGERADSAQGGAGSVTRLPVPSERGPQDGGSRLRILNFDSLNN